MNMQPLKYIISLLWIIVIPLITHGENIDERRQSFIKDFLSYYQSAYQKEDLEYISLFYSNDALILTETKQLKSIGNELTPYTTKVRPFHTIVENRKEYINKLKEYFHNNSKIAIGISNIRIKRHPKYPDIYGINFYQIWNDLGKNNILENKMPGYIFLMIDFRESEIEPIIHVRTWQPKENIASPADKYQLTDFRILSTK